MSDDIEDRMNHMLNGWRWGIVTSASEHYAVTEEFCRWCDTAFGRGQTAYVTVDPGEPDEGPMFIHAGCWAGFKARNIHSDDYATITVVVRRRGADEVKPLDYLTVTREDDVMFVGSELGVSYQAFLAGASPSDWPEAEDARDE